MTLQEIEARKAEIAIEVEAEGADLDALQEEVRSLNEQKAELESAMEKRQAIIDEVKAIQPEETRTFKDEEKEERKMMDIGSKEYRDLWLANLQGRQSEEVRSFATSDNNNAVPTLVADQFFMHMKKLAPMLDEITLLRVAGNIKFVAQDTVNDATKHTENASISPAEDTIVNVTLGGFEFAKVLRISKAVQTMSIDAFEAWLVEYLAGDIAKAIDKYILTDSSNGVKALTYETGTNQILSTTGYTYANICDLIALLPASYDAEAKFIVNKKTLYGKIMQITSSTGMPVFVMDTEKGNQGRILGYPVVVDDYVATGNDALYLGAWKNVVGNLSQDVTVERSEQSGFLNGSIDFRGYALFDSKVANKEAIVRLVSTTSTAY